MIRMAFSRNTSAILFILLCSIAFLQTKGQTSDFYKTREKEADSLAHLEKHKEAVEILMSIIEARGKELLPNDLLRLDYKTGFSLMHSGRDADAMPYFRKVITKGDPRFSGNLINDAMTGLGVTYEYTGKHDSAFYWYMEAYKQVRESDDTLRRARSARNMAQLLRVLNRFDEARSYCRKAVDLIPGIQDHKVVANIYNETAYLFELADDLDSAAYYYQQLIHISVSNAYSKGESVGYSNLASVYEKQKKFDDALKFKLKSIEINKKINDTYGMMASYRGLSTTYFLSGNYIKALEALDLAQELCDTTWLPDLAGINLGYYEIYKGKGQFARALYYYETYNRLHDRINQQESRKQVAEILTRYETERKEQQIELLEQANMLKENKIRMQKTIIGAMILLALSVLLSASLWIKNNNQKLRQMNIELQHFVMRQEKADNISLQDGVVSDPGEIYKKWGLTSRESEILYYLNTGYSNCLIGEKLFISENTVKFHIKNIYLKLDVKNRIQALLRCKNDQPDI